MQLLDHGLPRQKSKGKRQVVQPVPVVPLVLCGVLLKHQPFAVGFAGVLGSL